MLVINVGSLGKGSNRPKYYRTIHVVLISFALVFGLFVFGLKLVSLYTEHGIRNPESGNGNGIRNQISMIKN